MPRKIKDFNTAMSGVLGNSLKRLKKEIFSDKPTLLKILAKKGSVICQKS